MSAELSLTIGLLAISGFFIFLGEKLMRKAKEHSNVLIFNIGLTSYFASGIFFTILLFILWQFVVLATYAGVVKAVFIFFMILTGLVTGVGFFIMSILTVVALYGSYIQHFKKKKNAKRYN